MKMRTLIAKHLRQTSCALLLLLLLLLQQQLLVVSSNNKNEAHAQLLTNEQQRQHDQHQHQHHKQRHHQHYKQHKHQHQHAINSLSTSGSTYALQSSSSTMRPTLTTHQHVAVKHQHQAHHRHNHWHAHDQFSTTFQPNGYNNKHHHYNNNNNNYNKHNHNSNHLAHEPGHDKLANNWLDQSVPYKTDDDIYVHDDYYDTREDVDNYAEPEYARVTRHLPDSEYAEDEPFRREPGILTKQKFQDLGNKESVQQSRNRYMQEIRRTNSEYHRLAEDHFNHMKVATQCGRPLPRVVPVSNVTSKRYEPPCTLLHRCGEDTGCCNGTHVCSVKSFEEVSFYFYVSRLNAKGTEIEVLKLTNHTECHCVNRRNLQRRKRSGIARNNHNFANETHRHKQIVIPDQNKAVKPYICHCPKHFDVFVAQQDLTTSTTTAASASAHEWHNRNLVNCRCDCLSENLPCQRLKDGEEGFAVDDRKCIAARKCRTPTCTHGEYSQHQGRCPRQRDAHKSIDMRHDYAADGADDS